MTQPVRPEEVLDEDTKRILAERLKTADEDARTAVDARQALKEIRRNLKQSAPL